MSDATNSTTVIDMQNWGMSNPAYRRYRKQELREILRGASSVTVPAEVLRRGGDAVLDYYRRRTSDNSLTQQSARAMLSYIERFEAGRMSQDQCVEMMSAMKSAVAGVRAAILAFGLSLRPALERATQQMREFGAAMERALEEDQRVARFVQPHTDRAGLPVTARRGLCADRDGRLAHPGRGRDRTRG